MVIHNDSAEKFISIPKLDTIKALNLIGSEKLFWDVLKNYYEVIDKKISKIRNFFEQKDWEAYTIEVHALKSASRQIGAIPLSEKAAALEKAGNEKNIDMIMNETDSMLEEYAGYKEILKPYFDKEKVDDADKLPMNFDTLKSQLATMLEGIDDLNMSIMDDTIEEMDKYLYKGKHHEYFEKLKVAENDYDVELCENIINEWKSEF